MQRHATVKRQETARNKIHIIDKTKKVFFSLSMKLYDFRGGGLPYLAYTGMCR